MQITRNSIETTSGPSDWFTGNVYVDAVAVPTAPSRLQASGVRFTPNARTAWHTHPKWADMTHLAMLDVDDEGNNATWGDHVTEEEYAAVPAS